MLSLPLLERRKYISTYINEFLPKVMVNLISEYDYSLIGQSYIFVKQMHGIECMNILPDGQIASGSFDKLIKIWDLKTTYYEHNTIDDTAAMMICMSVLPDHRIIAAIEKINDFSLEIFDGRFQSEANNVIEKCDLKFSEKNTHTHTIYCIDVISDCNGYRIISGSEDCTLKIWDPMTGKCSFTLEGHSDGVVCIAVLSANHVVSGSRDYTLKMWNLQTRMCEVTLNGHSGAIFSVATLGHSHGYRIVSGSSDSTLKIWNISLSRETNIYNYCCQLTLLGHTDSVYCIGILPDGRIISGSEDKTIKIWNEALLKEDKCEMTLYGHTNTVSCISILPDGRVISGSHDQTIRVWS